MHRHDARLRQQEIQECEYRFLHFAGIGSAANEHDLACEIAGNNRLGAAAMTFWMRTEAWQVENGHFGKIGLQRVAVRADQQVADEERVPGIFGDHA